MSQVLTPSPNAVPARFRPLVDPFLVLGLAVGLTPLLAGIVFRTYVYHVTPGWPEGLRQLDAPFIFVEFAIIMWARHRNLRFRSIFERLDSNARFALIIFLCTFWISSAFISANPVYSLIRAAFWLVHLAFGFAVFHLVSEHSRAQILRCGVGLIAGFVLFLPLTAFHLANVPDPSTVRGGSIIWSSAIPGCLSIRHLGIWSALVLSIALGSLYLGSLSARSRMVSYSLVFLSTAALFWSGTRAGVYGTAAALAAGALFVRKKPSWRTAALAAVFCGMGMIFSQTWLPPDPAFGIFSRTNLPGGQTLEAFSSGRVSIWMGMLSAFRSSPLFGVGEGAIHWLIELPNHRHVQPHNSLVQFLSSWGVPASVAAGYLLGRLVILAHRVANRETLAIPIVLTMNCLLVMSLADGALYFSRFIMWFAACGAVVLAMAANGPATSLDNRRPS